MVEISCVTYLRRRWYRFVLLAMLAMSAGKSYAYNLILENLSNGYSSCYWADNGDGTSTVKTTIDYKSTTGYLGSSRFTSRGVLLYTYDKNGNLSASSSVASAVYMNDEKHTSLFKDMAGGYVMYNGALAIYSSQWKTEKQFTANIKITISNKDIKDWPAIGIRAGNYTNGDDIGEKSGVAYIRYGEDQGVCTIVVEPELPPPPVEIAIGMSAPDWSLGDLPRGTSEKTLSKTADQLCFTYSGPAVKDKKFVINASNANGFVDKNYRLNNLDDASKFVPYSIALNSGASTLSLPNSADTALPLDSSGKTCFVPTFKTTVDAQAKDGDYSDVLTFTVVTKP